MTEDAALLRLELPGRAEAPAAARRALAALNGDLHLISEARLLDAQLLVTELITNSIRHTASETVALRVSADPRTLRVEVGQAGQPFDPLPNREPSLTGDGGWGLRIVDVVSSRWGVHDQAERTWVWFELERPQTETPVEFEGEAPPGPEG
jgi:anti-sigma regulatory factor (Ser/Thr protein kinase)